MPKQGKKKTPVPPLHLSAEWGPTREQGRDQGAERGRENTLFAPWFAPRCKRDSLTVYKTLFDEGTQRQIAGFWLESRETRRREGTQKRGNGEKTYKRRKSLHYLGRETEGCAECWDGRWWRKNSFKNIIKRLFYKKIIERKNLVETSKLLMWLLLTP